MIRHWLDDATGAVFTAMAVFGSMLLLDAMGAKNDMAIALPLAVAGVIGWARWAYVRWSRPAEPLPALTSGEMDAVRGRLEEVDLLQARLAELEERVEFSERLLARKDGVER